jgi:hypothetical protein
MLWLLYPQGMKFIETLDRKIGGPQNQFRYSCEGKIPTVIRSKIFVIK